MLFSEEAQKATQFIQLANQVDVPLLFLHNTTGYMVGAEYEQGGIIKHGAQMINAVSNSKVPHLSVIMGASYGAGNYGMNGRAYDPRFLFTWPSAKSAVMGPAQLAGVLSIVARAAAEARGQAYDEEGDVGMRAFVEQSVEEQSLPFFLSGMLYDDGVIDPRTPGPCWPSACRSSRTRRSAGPRVTGSSGHDRQARSVRRLLVANRAEIASRVFRTCRRLGIETVAVHSDADADLPYVREADVAVRLPGSSPADTYLRVDLLVDAALKVGRGRRPPGVRLPLRERRLRPRRDRRGPDLGGPSPESIEAMGSRSRPNGSCAKPGSGPETPDEPTEADLPLLVKASAGGGGRGMRVVRRLADLAAEVAARRLRRCRRSGTARCSSSRTSSAAATSRSRSSGAQGVTVLGERDCSIQRRHQKVVEESPAPSLPVAVATALHDAARRGGRGDRLPRRRDRGVPLRPEDPSASGSWR